MLRTAVFDATSLLKQQSATSRIIVRVYPLFSALYAAEKIDPFAAADNHWWVIPGKLLLTMRASIHEQPLLGLSEILLDRNLKSSWLSGIAVKTASRGIFHRA